MVNDITQIQDVFRQVNLEGWLEDWDIENIMKNVGDLEDGQVYLEIGVAFGKSLAAACLAAKNGVKIYGIDEVDWKDRDENIEKFLNHFDKEKDYLFINNDSQLAARYWRKEKIDVLFIDGDHTYEAVVKDIASWIPWVNSGGIIMFDDYNEVTGVKKAITEILYEHMAFEDHYIDHEMYICRKK